VWAAFTALVNERAQNAGKTSVGFANPAIYTIGQSPAQYAADFNDMTNGNNAPATPCPTPPGSPPIQFNAVVGYDLVTGWGSPKLGLINDLTFGFTNVVSLGITVATGNDNARSDSEIWATVPGEPTLCLKPSNNANSDSVCPNGGSAADQNGQQEWKNFTSSAQTFTLATPESLTALSTMTVRLISHNNGGETDDNWDIQGITVFATDTTGGTTTLLNVSNPNNGSNCIVRLTGKIGSFTFILNPGNPTGSNPGIPPGSCPQSQ